MQPERGPPQETDNLVITKMKVDRKKYRPEVIDILNKKLVKHGHQEYSEKSLKNNCNAIFFMMDKVYGGVFKTSSALITSCPMDMLLFFESYANPHTRISYCRAVRWYLSEHPNADVYKAIDEAYGNCVLAVDAIDTNCPTDRMKECTETIKELQDIFLNRYNASVDKEDCKWALVGYHVFVPSCRNDFYGSLYCTAGTDTDISDLASKGNNVLDIRNYKMYYGDSKTLNFKRNRNGTARPIIVDLDMDERYKDILKNTISNNKEKGWVNKKGVAYCRIFPSCGENDATRRIKAIFGDKYNIQILRKKWATESVGSGSVSTMKTNANAMLHHVGTHVGYYATEEKKEEKEI